MKAKETPKKKLPSTPPLLIEFLAERLGEAAELGDFAAIAKMATVQGQLLGLIASQPGRPKKPPPINVGAAELDSDEVMAALKAAGVCL